MVQFVCSPPLLTADVLEKTLTTAIQTCMISAL